MTCGSKVNNMGKCVVLPQSLSTRRVILKTYSPRKTSKHIVRNKQTRQEPSAFGEAREEKRSTSPQGRSEVVMVIMMVMSQAQPAPRLPLPSFIKGSGVLRMV